MLPFAALANVTYRSPITMQQFEQLVSISGASRPGDGCAQRIFHSTVRVDLNGDGFDVRPAGSAHIGVDDRGQAWIIAANPLTLHAVKCCVVAEHDSRIPTEVAYEPIAEHFRMHHLSITELEIFRNRLSGWTIDDGECSQNDIECVNPDEHCCEVCCDCGPEFFYVEEKHPNLMTKWHRAYYQACQRQGISYHGYEQDLNPEDA